MGRLPHLASSLAFLLVTGSIAAIEPAGLPRALVPRHADRGGPGARVIDLPTNAVRSADSGVRLVVMIAVDQLRGDLLPIYRRGFTGGLARLLAEGRHFPNTRVDHAPTNSMPGHVTLATGAHPRHHGLVDNGFFEIVPGGPTSYVNAVADSTERIVGFPALPGVSPRRLAVDGLADWIVAADTGARAVAISMNEYGALLHAGRGADRRLVYWYSPDAGRFVTSTFYRRDDPDWIQRFNDRLGAGPFADSSWESSVPAALRSLALPDSGRYENGASHVAFPHRFPAEQDETWKPTFGHWLYFTPHTDRAALELTREAVAALRLGRRGALDYLSVTLGSSDGIGHWFGPRSQEQLDNLLRLDRALGDLLAFLDREVGAGRYLVALAADHGAPELPEAPVAPGAIDLAFGRPGRVTDSAVTALFQELGDRVPRSLPPDSARALAAAILRSKPYVAAVMTRAELADSVGAPADSFVALYRNSYHPRRIPVRPLAGRFGTLASYGLTARLAPGLVVGEVPVEHGSSYEYDRRVALVFFGAGIVPGIDSTPVRTIDVAPTLAALAGVPVPAVDGRPVPGGR